MKRLMTAFAFVVMCHVASFAQIVGGFTTGNDGHIYFQAGNNTYYTYQVKIVAVSSDRRNSEQRVLAPGNGFYLLRVVINVLTNLKRFHRPVSSSLSI